MIKKICAAFTMGAIALVVGIADISQAGIDLVIAARSSNAMSEMIRIYNDADRKFGACEESDLVFFEGGTIISIPLPSTVYLFGTGIAVLIGTRIVKKKRTRRSGHSAQAYSMINSVEAPNESRQAEAERA